MIRKTIHWALAGMALATLAACGGSASDGNLGPGNPSVSVSVGTTSLPANPGNFQPDPDSDFTTSVTVRYRNPDGSAPPDGTSVDLSSSDSSIGVVSSQNDPHNTGSSATAETSGGVASFWFTSGPSEGTVTLTGSADNLGGGGSVTGTAQITVTEGEFDGRLTISGKSTLPANKTDVPIFFGSPYIAEMTVRYFGPDGNAGSVDGGEIEAAVSPTFRAAFSTLCDPETGCDDPENNEFFHLVGNGPVSMAAGQSTIFVHSFDEPGTATLTVSAQDAETGENFSESFDIEIIDGGADFLPAQVAFDLTDTPVYTQGSGGPTTKSVAVEVADSSGNPVPDPEADGQSYNNVHLELVAPDGSGARLVGTNADGNSVNGTEISVPTTGGVAGFSLAAGSKTGSHQIIATVDRADNNVDNGLQDPTSSQATIQVGDGKLFSLELVSPIISAIRVNRVSGAIETEEEFTEDPETGTPIPPDPDGTYSFRVTVQGTDQVGNPALPGTLVNFGKIDAPTTPTQPPTFVFSGGQGDPEEAGTLFTVADSQPGFVNNPNVPDEDVEIGDTLTLFGKSVPGNREHEAVRFVDSVVDDATLHVTEPFNPNNQSGSIVDDGPVIPWVIGRSEAGNIENSAVLGEQGRASVWMTYPINRLGMPLVVWSQGTRPEDSNQTKTVADAEPMTFPGIAPLVLLVDPSSVPGNQSVGIQVCLRDAIGSPLQGVFVGVAQSGQSSGSASIDGQSLDSGNVTTANSTGPGGCLTTTLSTTGMVPGGGEMEIIFFVGQYQATVQVNPPDSAVLNAYPSQIIAFIGQTRTQSVSLSLRDSGGQPIGGAPIESSCSTTTFGTINVFGGGVTTANGTATSQIVIDLSDSEPGVPEPGDPVEALDEATCTFSAAGAEADVEILVFPDFAGGGGNGD